jgi:hypothetical protein
MLPSELLVSHCNTASHVSFFEQLNLCTVCPIYRGWQPFQSISTSLWVSFDLWNILSNCDSQRFSDALVLYLSWLSISLLNFLKDDGFACAGSKAFGTAMRCQRPRN